MTWPTRPRNSQPTLRERIQQGPRYSRWVLLSCLSGLFASTFTITILGVSLKPIAEDLGSSVSIVAWVITAPMLAQALSLPLLGKLGDIHGHRRVYLIGSGFATVAAFVTAMAWNAESLVSFRTVAQLFGTATMPASTALLFSVHRPEERVKAMGWVSLVSAGAPVFGLALGGYLVDTIGWRPLFWIQGGLSVVAFSIARYVLAETPPGPRTTLDWRGAAWLALAAFGLTFGINQAPQRGFDTIVVAGLLAVPLALAAFIRTERRARHPLIPLEFFGRRNFTLPMVAGFFLNLAYMGSFIISPLLLMNVFAFSATVTSFITMLRPLSFSAASPVGGSMATRVGERAMTSTGTAAIGIAMAAFAIGAHSGSLLGICAGLVVAGLGLGLCQPSISAIVGNSVDPHSFGVASSALATANSIGAVTGISLLTAITAGAQQTTAFTEGYLLCLVAGALALVTTRFIEPGRSSETVALEPLRESPGVAGEPAADAT